MSPCKILSLDYLLRSEWNGSDLNRESGCVISVGYELLTFSVFHSLIKGLRPKVFLDARASASFRDRGFTAERAFRIFADYKVEYRRLVDAHCSLDQLQIESLTKSALFPGIVFLLGSACDHAGSEREQVVERLSAIRSTHVVFHERHSLARWVLTESNKPVSMNQLTPRSYNLVSAEQLSLFERKSM
jgi:hypothetical protein